MPDFSDMADDAKKFANEHPEQADKGLDEANKFADDKTGNRFDKQTDKGEQEAENFLGTDQQQGQQQQPGQQQQSQDQYGNQDQGGQDQGGQYGNADDQQGGQRY